MNEHIKKTKKALRLNVNDIAILGILVAVIVASNFLDNLIPGLAPLHLITTGIIFTIIGPWQAAIVLTVFAIIFYATGGISFIVAWQQFVLLWISGYFLILYSLFPRLCVSKKTGKINPLYWFLLFFPVWLLFFAFVVFANTYYFPGTVNVLARIQESFLLPGNWLNTLVAGVGVVIIAPLVWKPLYKQYRKIYTASKIKF